MNRRIMAWCTVLTGLSVVSAAGAATVYDDLFSFSSAAGSLHLEDFESSPLVGSTQGGAVSLLPFDGFRVRSDPDSLRLLDVAFAGLHSTSVFGPRYLAADTGSLAYTPHVTLEFEPPIDRLGFYIVDLETFPMEVTIDGVVYTIAPAGDGGLSYFGIIGDGPFDRVELHSTGGEVRFNLDDLLFPSPPAPLSSGEVSPDESLYVFPALGGDLNLLWSDSCKPSDSDFEIYEGVLGQFASHEARACSTGGMGAATLTPAPGDTYYLVVPRNVTREGSYGRDSTGSERFRPATACLLPSPDPCP